MLINMPINMYIFPAAVFLIIVMAAVLEDARNIWKVGFIVAVLALVFTVSTRTIE